MTCRKNRKGLRPLDPGELNNCAAKRRARLVQVSYPSCGFTEMKWQYGIFDARINLSAFRCSTASAEGGLRTVRDSAIK